MVIDLCVRSFYALCVWVGDFQPVFFCGRLAQLVEHLTFNQGVIGSNPIAPTTDFPVFVVGVAKTRPLLKTENHGGISPTEFCQKPAPFRTRRPSFLVRYPSCKR